MNLNCSSLFRDRNRNERYGFAMNAMKSMATIAFASNIASIAVKV